MEFFESVDDRTPRDERLHAKQLRNACQRSITELLDGVSGSKATVWDEPLMERMLLITGAKLFKEKQTNEFYKLVGGNSYKCESANVLFFVRPWAPLLDLVDEFMQNCASNLGSKTLMLYFVPNYSVSCMEKLQELGIDKRFTHIGSLPLYIYPLDVNVFSMEQPLCFKELYVDQDISSLTDIANSLRLLESLYGGFKLMSGFGVYSNQIISMLNQNNDFASCVSGVSLIDQLVLIDRNVDLITPLMGQLTYEGLVDEVLGISCGLTAQSVSVANSNGTTADQRVGLFSVESSREQSLLYAKLRSCNFFDVGALISFLTKTLIKEADKAKASRKVSDMKEFVNRLPQLNAIKLQISLYTTIAETLKSHTDTSAFSDSLKTENDLFIESSLSGTEVHPLIEKKIALGESFEEVTYLNAVF